MAVSPRLRKIREALTQAVRKHFGKKSLRFDSPEPHYNFFKHTWRSMFRRQGSVNKALIATLRCQERWNEQMEAKLAHAEARIAVLEARLQSAPEAPQFIPHAPALPHNASKVMEIINTVRGV